MSCVTLALLLASSLLAQHTVVQDAGGGRKLELHYNAAGQITETDTLGPKGELLEKDVLEYSPGYYVPQSISTSYWPNGRVHKITENNYDSNSNFTREYIQVFDDSGKQIGGHRLTHDPETNIYACADWNTAKNVYTTIECPAGEESGGEETVKKFTAEGANQQLARARQAAMQPPKPGAATATPTGTAMNVREVGLVLPAHIRPGERVSGSVVEDPDSYAGLPGIVVTRVALPFAGSGAGATLAGWKVELSGEPPQSADCPIALTVPPGQIELAVLFRQVGNEGAPVSKAIPTPSAPHAKAKPATTYLAPAICLKSQLCMVRGQFSGNSSKSFAAFEERPAKIVAETSDTAYVAIPEMTEPGSRPLVIAEGTKVIAFPTVVAKFSMPPDRRDLPKGEKMLIYLTLEGPEDLPDAQWRAGNYPPSNLEEARKVIPGFEVPQAAAAAHEKREAKEKDKDSDKDKEKDKEAGEESGSGQILLFARNLTPAAATFQGANNGTFVFRLNADSFKRGEFKYKFVVEALTSGSFGLEGNAIPFLAPVTGQQFPIAPNTAAQ